MKGRLNGMQLDVKSDIAHGPFHVLFHVLNVKSIFFFNIKSLTGPRKLNLVRLSSQLRAIRICCHATRDMFLLPG